MSQDPRLIARASRYRPGIWCLWVFVLVATPAGVFLGWNAMTRGVAMRTVQMEAEKELAVRLCIANFRASANAEDQLADLRNVAEWARPRLIAKGGWDRLPTLGLPLSGVAELCAARLINDQDPSKYR